eukprot:scaffold20749_cov109-Isochrysis_galbana.AAC.5
MKTPDDVARKSPDRLPRFVFGAGVAVCWGLPTGIAPPPLSAAWPSPASLPQDGLQEAYRGPGAPALHTRACFSAPSGFGRSGYTTPPCIAGHHSDLAGADDHEDTTKILQTLTKCYPVPDNEAEAGVHELLGPANQRIVRAAMRALDTGDLQVSGGRRWGLRE